jgi:hypothetical protein
MTSAFNIFLSTNSAQIGVGFGTPAAWTRRGVAVVRTGRSGAVRTGRDGDFDVLAASGAG